MISSACAILRALAVSCEPKLEWLISATFGLMPNRRRRKAACSADSAICSAVGSTCTCVSVKKKGPFEVITADSADSDFTAGSSPSTSSTCLSLPL